MGQEQLIISQKVQSRLKKQTLMDSDETLARIRRLDMDTLAQVHERYFPDVYRYVHFRLTDPQVCEDIASDVFLHLLTSLQRGAGPTQNLRAWLFGVASNLINDHLRQIYMKPDSELDSLENLPGLDDPAASFENHWRSEELAAAIQKLTAEQQKVLALRFAGEYSLEETADLMKRSVNAVKVLQFRAVAALRRLLEGKRLL